MSIKELLHKINPIKRLAPRGEIRAETFEFDERGEVVELSPIRKLFLAILIILVGTLSFGLGRLSVVNNHPGVKIEYNESMVGSNQLEIENSKIDNSAPGAVVGSSKGTKYHYSYCPGAKQISEDNRIIFASVAQAISAGYTLAGNCKEK